VRLAEEHGSPIDLRGPTSSCPRWGDAKLAQRSQPFNRASKVLFLSGYTDDAIVHHGVLDAASPSTEAFKPDELVRKIREVLDDTQ